MDDRVTELLDDAGAYLGMIAEVRAKAILLKNQHWDNHLRGSEEECEDWIEHIDNSVEQMSDDLAKYRIKLEEVYEELAEYGIVSDISRMGD